MIKEAYEAGVKQALFDQVVSPRTISPLLKYVGTGALTGGLLGGIAGQDVPTALKGALAGGAAGLGAYGIPELARNSKKLEDMIVENAEQALTGPKYYRGAAAETADRLGRFRSEGGGAIGKILGGLGGAAGGGAGLGLGALLSPSSAPKEK